MNTIAKTQFITAALLLTLIGAGLLHNGSRTAQRGPAGTEVPRYLSETPQAHLVTLPKLFDFYANLFTEINSHGDKISGEDVEKIKHFINQEIKLVLQVEKFKITFDRDILPYFNDLPSNALRLQNHSLYLSELSQNFSYLSEVTENQIVIFKNQGLVSLGQNYSQILTSQTIAASLNHLMLKRSPTNLSTFSRSDGELRPYFLKLVVMKTHESLPNNFTVPMSAGTIDSPNSLKNFAILVAHIEFQARQKLRAIPLMTETAAAKLKTRERKNASL